MNNEIKEKVDIIIKKVRVAMIKHREGFYDYDMLVCHELDYNEWNTLLDYITNLQQENEILFKEKLDIQKDLTNRINKANEYLDKVETLAMLDGKIIFSLNIFRNILQNGSENE